MKTPASVRRASLPRAAAYTKQFAKDWERLSRSGHYDMRQLKEAILLLIASDVAKRDPLSVHDGPLHGVEEWWRGAGMGHPVPAGRVDDDCRRRRLGS